MTAYLFLPFFNGLGVTTAYEYLEMRFSLAVRLIASFLFIARVLLYLSTAMYAPALALDAVANVPSWATIVVCGVASGVYTVAGGLRAVIYTDVMQFFVLVAGVCIVLFVATLQVGSVSEVVRLAREGDRLTLFKPNVDLSDDYSTWNLMLGKIVILSRFVAVRLANPKSITISGGVPFNLVQLATDQISVQRYLSAKSIRSARNGLWLKLVLTIGISLLSYVAGTVLFAYYNSGGRDDPVAVNLTVPDQILPYFAVNALPVGVPGVIVAAIFAATMSTTSSGLNAIATALSTDFARTLNWLGSDQEVLTFSRWTTVFATVLMVGVSLGIATIGDALIETSQVMNGIAGGPLLGIFLLGIGTRWASAGGALFGGIVGALCMGAVSAAKYTCRGDVTCPGWLQQIGTLSVFLYAGFGCAITLVAGAAGSLIWRLPPEGWDGLAGLRYGDEQTFDVVAWQQRTRRRGSEAAPSGGIKASLLAGEHKSDSIQPG